MNRKRHIFPAFYFYPRPPRGGRPGRRRESRGGPDVSIHALREEGDQAGKGHCIPNRKFLSTPSARRATQLTNGKRAAIPISIHALREEGDRTPLKVLSPTQNFYPRPPRGGRLTGWLNQNNNSGFLSTPSARRATTAFPASSLITKISIHALREEGDAVWTVSTRVEDDFYPRPPRGGRHNPPGQGLQLLEISIHALREEGDHSQAGRDPLLDDFYPRPPRGGRPTSATVSTTSCAYFYPRPPRGGRPGHQPPHLPPRKISIHALREEGDLRAFAWPFVLGRFLSTPSARRATLSGVTTRQLDTVFLSTPSARRATHPTNVEARVLR